MGKMTKARLVVLRNLARRDGKATPYDLAYPRSNMMHNLFMDGLVGTEGPQNAWGEPAHDGFWVLTPAGRSALDEHNGK